jgi:hypothetical protein
MGRKSIILASALTIALLAAAILMVAAYKRDARLEIFINNHNEVTDEIVNEVNDNPTLAGVIAAQTILSEKKGGLKKEYAELKDVDGSRVSGKTLLMFQEGVKNNIMKIKQLLGNPAVVQVARKDPEFKERILKLVAEHKSLTE